MTEHIRLSSVLGRAALLLDQSYWRNGFVGTKGVELSNQDVGEPKPDSSERSGFSPGIAHTDRTEMAADKARVGSHEQALRRWARQGSGGGEKKRGVKTAIFDHDDSRNKVTEGRLSRRLRQLT